MTHHEGSSMSIEAAASGAAYAAAKGLGMKAAIGGGGVAFGMVMGTAVVMILKRPRTTGEWAVALISSVMSSTCLGAAVILYFNLLNWVLVADPVRAFTGLMAVVGVVFACCLPGWVIVRIAFNTMAKFQDKSLDDAYTEVKGIL